MILKPDYTQKTAKYIFITSDLTLKQQERYGGAYEMGRERKVELNRQRYSVTEIF